MAGEVKLKPCPFCGGLPMRHTEGMWSVVRCTSCGARSNGINTPEGADEMWNRRTNAT